MTIEEKIETFAPQLEMMPGISVVHQIENYHPVYMTSNGLQLFGLSLEELLAIGEDYFKEFFNKDFTNEFFEKLVPLIKQESPEETFTLFHQVQFPAKDEFEWFVSSVRIFHSVEEIPTHTLSISFPIGEMDYIPHKAEKLLNENEFSRKNLKKFLSLTGREKEVLKLLAEGKNTREISGLLSISTDTVNSHKKSMKHKLDISSYYDISRYAYAFDLV